MAETIILALRLNEGLDLADFAARFATDVPMAYPGVVEQLTSWGLVEHVEEPVTRRLRLSERGRLVGNEVFERFLPVED